ncbi:SipW-dependent-type signal peptide-containing protein [Georgenia sp. MJ173]|uniref:SipW-dependent-type signal peptide-containing protein n=1 Tax=Georgenia sunbinii TaxID=3117728 RepID=UPI002F26A81C
MSTTTATTARSKKVKAALAGGLVLGIGAAVTLASWTDQAYVDAQFGTSEFNIQVQTTEEAGWVEADQDAGADASTLAFTVDFADALQPGDTVYAPLDLQTDETSVAGTVTLEPASADDAGTGGLFDALTYTVTELAADATCDADAAGTALVTNAGLATGSETGAISLGAEGVDPSNLCFAVTLPESADSPDLQGLTTTALWRLAAESVDNA